MYKMLYANGKEEIKDLAHSYELNMNRNLHIIIGRISKDPELRANSTGVQVAQFGVATNRKKSDGKEETQFHNVVAFGKQAEIIHKFLKKGDEIYVEGRVQTRSYDHPDGTKKWMTETILEKFEFGRKKGDGKESDPIEWN